MKKNKRMYGKRTFVVKLLSIFLTATLLFLMGPAEVKALSKETATRDIAIVFDNSGSMYWDGSQGLNRWCQANYAIEVFTAMINEGDTITIFPMNPIEIDGREYTSTSPLTITDPEDAPVIQDIFSPGKKVDTPIESIEDARKYLQRSTAQEQWLVVVTDGNTFYRDGKSLKKETMKELTKEMEKAVNLANTVYFGIGVDDVPKVSNDRYKAFAVDDENILSELSKTCNFIFGRDELPSEYSNGSSVQFDVPMSKMILFMQGADLSDVRLEGAGNAASVIKTHYSEKGAGGDYKNVQKIDESLQGVIVTYKDLEAGQYDLSYNGSPSSFSVYYEPDVDLYVNLLDKDGNALDFNQDINPGQYRVEYALIDKYGEKLDSPLLGKTNYSFTYTLNGEQKTIADTKAGVVPIDLGVGDSFSADDISVEFLSGYRINKTGGELGWPELGFTIQARSAGTLELSGSGGEEEYALNELEEKGVYTLTLKHDGAPVTGSELDEIKWDVRISGKDGPVPEIEMNPDGATVSLKYNKNDMQKTVCGTYDLSVTASWTNEDGAEAVSNPFTSSFELKDVVNALAMTVKAGQSYVQTSKLADAKPVRIDLLMNGMPLTDEQLQAVAIQTDSDLVLSEKRLIGESAIELNIDPDQKISKGKHEIGVKSSMIDEVGRELTAEDKTSIEFQPYPVWLRWAIIAAILAAIIAALLAILNAKVLPKAMMIPQGDTVYSVDGENVNSATNVDFKGGGKKKGSMSIKVPKYSDDPGVGGSFSLELEAISPRKTKSQRRQAAVTKVSATSTVKSFRIGAVTFERDETGQFTKAGKSSAAKKGDKNQKTMICKFGNNAQFEILGESIQETSFCYSGKIKFK